MLDSASQAYINGSYQPHLVALSLLIAVLSFYSALDLVARICGAAPRAAAGWLVGGALAVGTGIWSTHFIGLLAFQLPITVGYAPIPTALAWVLGVGASGLALYVSSRARLSRSGLVTGAALAAILTTAMHYAGMAAIQVTPGIVYGPLWAALSLALALASWLCAIRIGFALRAAGRARGPAVQRSAAVLIAAGIAGVHYAGAAGAFFAAGSVGTAVQAAHPGWLALLIGISSTLLLIMASVASALDRRLESRTARLVDSLSSVNAKLRFANRHDPLTHLANRNLLQERLEQAVRRWQKNAESFAVIYIDLDGFKVLNDSLGHDIGDTLLVRAAIAMQQTVRHRDTVARVGGDEFVLIVHDAADERAVGAVCRKLLDALHEISSDTVRLSASAGAALCPNHGKTASELMAAADLAMYSAKKTGTNRHLCYRQPMSDRVSEEFAIQNELAPAIEAGHIVVHYQPKYTVRNRVMVGAEALVRWQHPSKGLIGPDRFIPAAERFGLIDDLETHVLNSVCAEIRGWLDAGLQAPAISVNLSAVRLRDPDLPARVQACLEKYKVNARYLMFEITESLAIQEILRAIETLNHFKRMGVDVALDDFGTGHSSLSYLKQLPIQQLKIDRSFTNDLGRHDNNQVAIVRSIISLAHALGLKVVAEGVETEQQLLYLDEFDCDQIQGFLFSRPVPAEVFAGLIAAGSRAVIDDPLVAYRPPSVAATSAADHQSRV